jgi:uncharacterized protein YbaR (Trm112 family)
MITREQTRKLRTHLYKACPRCQGDLVMDPESELGELAQVAYVCLQCGRRTTLRALLEQQARQKSAA